MIIILIVIFIWIIGGIINITSFTKYNKRMIRTNTGLYISICSIFVIFSWIIYLNWDK